MSDTPRTDAKRGFHDLDTAVDAEFSEQLERELNAANERIKRLEEAGDAILNANNDDEEYEAIKQWYKVKEAKP